MGDDFDPGVFESSQVTAFEMPEFTPADPDTGLNVLPSAPFVSKSDVLRDLEIGIPQTAAPSNGVVSAFDWSQLGDTFTRVGAQLAPILRSGSDIAAVVMGRPTSAQKATQAAQAQAARQKSLLLYAVGGGILLMILMGRKRR